MFELHRVGTVFPSTRQHGVLMHAAGLTRCGMPISQFIERKGRMKYDPLVVGETVGETLYGSQPGNPDIVCDKCFTEADLPALIAEGWD